eukprot:COSAG01_NODE_27906_length_674_cov_0.699130_1_plen_45_part_10
MDMECIRYHRCCGSLWGIGCIYLYRRWALYQLDKSILALAPGQAP